ncbi:MAG: DUF3618 domain-containing protein [Dermatophilus congolensis]|nr:DUF3618 domain-containing protein [Dermatophilus congolensis]
MATSDNRSTQDIEKEIEQSRARLAATVDELAFRVKPKNLAQRQMANARRGFHSATHTDSGDIKLEVVGPAVAVVAGLIALAIYRRVRG